MVADPADADLALLRLARRSSHERASSSPFSTPARSIFPRPTRPDPRSAGTVPTLVDLYLDRPAVVPEIAEAAAALLVDFGAADDALCRRPARPCAPQGRLPFDLPRSMDAVRRQHEDVPYDSEDPLFAFGHGLSY